MRAFALCIVVLPGTVALAQHRADTTVRLAGAPRYAGGGTLVQEVSIGSVTGAKEYLLNAVIGVVPLMDGSVLVLDGTYSSGGESFLRQYDASGRYLRTFGRTGQGPGEYLFPAGVRQLADGRIALHDASQHRINVYSLSGEPVDHWRFVESSGRSRMTDMLLTDTAGFLYRRTYVRTPAPYPYFERPIGYIRLRPGGQVVDTISPPVFSENPPALTARASDGSPRRVPIPKMPYGWWNWSPFGQMITWSEEGYAFEVRVPRPAPSQGGAGRPAVWQRGDPVLSIRRAVPPVPVSAEERAAARAELEASMKQDDPSWRWNGPDIPSVKSPIAYVEQHADGRFWVSVALPSERYTTPASGRSPAVTRWREPIAYDVFESDGTYLGRILPPRDTFIKSARGDIAWGISRDSDGVATVKRWRITWRS